MITKQREFDALIKKIAADDPTITAVDLSGFFRISTNKASAINFPALVRALKRNTHISSLDLSDNDLSWVDMLEIYTDWIEHPSLKTLNLSGNDFQRSKELAPHVRRFLQYTALTHLDLSHASNVDEEYLLAALGPSQLTTLNISNTGNHRLPAVSAAIIATIGRLNVIGGEPERAVDVQVQTVPVLPKRIIRKKPQQPESSTASESTLSSKKPSAAAVPNQRTRPPVKAKPVVSPQAQLLSAVEAALKAYIPKRNVTTDSPAESTAVCSSSYFSSSGPGEPGVVRATEFRDVIAQENDLAKMLSLIEGHYKSWFGRWDESSFKPKLHEQLLMLYGDTNEKASFNQTKVVTKKQALAFLAKITQQLTSQPVLTTPAIKIYYKAQG